MGSSSFTPGFVELHPLVACLPFVCMGSHVNRYAIMCCCVGITVRNVVEPNLKNGSRNLTSLILLLLLLQGIHVQFSSICLGSGHCGQNPTSRKSDIINFVVVVVQGIHVQFSIYLNSCHCGQNPTSKMAQEI